MFYVTSYTLNEQNNTRRILLKNENTKVVTNTFLKLWKQVKVTRTHSFITKRGPCCNSVMIMKWLQYWSL